MLTNPEGAFKGVLQNSYSETFFKIQRKKLAMFFSLRDP